MKRISQHFHNKYNTSSQVIDSRIFRNSLEMWSAGMHLSGNDPFAVQLNGSGVDNNNNNNNNKVKAIPYMYELLKYLFVGQTEYTLMALMLAFVEIFPKFTPKRNQQFLAQVDELRTHLDELLGKNGVLLFPTYPTTAPKHFEPAWRYGPFNFCYTAIFNVLELPVTQIPLGLDEKGLPLGAQIVGSYGNDMVTLAVANELERAGIAKWTPPNESQRLINSLGEYV